MKFPAVFLSFCAFAKIYVAGSIFPIFNTKFGFSTSDINAFLSIKTGTDIRKDKFWVYQGVIRNAMTGKPFASIEGIERVCPLEINQTISEDRLDAKDFKRSYISDKVFIYTEYGCSVKLFSTSLHLSDIPYSFLKK